jgi:hypothetical protein
MTENLFSYGTLQQDKVQLDIFGRLLTGYPDILLGYRLSWVEITDENVLASSGINQHPIIGFTGDLNDAIKGTVFKITAEEFKQADEYEADDYKRILVKLESGEEAWVYIDAR